MLCRWPYPQLAQGEESGRASRAAGGARRLGRMKQTRPASERTEGKSGRMHCQRPKGPRTPADQFRTEPQPCPQSYSQRRLTMIDRAEGNLVRMTMTQGYLRLAKTFKSQSRMVLDGFDSWAPVPHSPLISDSSLILISAVLLTVAIQGLMAAISVTTSPAQTLRMRR